MPKPTADIESVRCWHIMYTLKYTHTAARVYLYTYKKFVCYSASQCQSFIEIIDGNVLSDVFKPLQKICSPKIKYARNSEGRLVWGKSFGGWKLGSVVGGMKTFEIQPRFFDTMQFRGKLKAHALKLHRITTIYPYPRKHVSVFLQRRKKGICRSRIYRRSWDLPLFFLWVFGLVSRPLSPYFTTAIVCKNYRKPAGIHFGFIFPTLR